MIRAFTVILFLMFSSSAISETEVIPAAYKTTPYTYYMMVSFGCGTHRTVESLQTACGCTAPALNTPTWTSYGENKYLGICTKPSGSVGNVVAYNDCPSGFSPSGAQCQSTAKTCPDSTWIFNPTSSTCSRQKVSCPMYGTPEGAVATQDPPAGCECPAGHQWVPLNGCRKKCDREGQVGQPIGNHIYFPSGTVQTCHFGCIVNSSGEHFEYDDGRKLSAATWTNWACEQGQPEAQKPTEEPKEPPCPATHGVLTSSSGTVACVPPGPPNGRKPVVKESKVKEQYPDGSNKEVKKVETKDPKTGATHTQTTSTSSGGQSGPAGETKSTSTTSGGGSTSSGGGGSGEGDEPGQCAKEPESPMCKKGEVKKKGKFNDDSMQGDIDDAKGRYKQLINNIRTDIDNMFDLSLSGGGSLPCPPPVNVMGASFGICFADYSESLSIIGLGILFIAAILSAFIILRK